MASPAGSCGPRKSFNAFEMPPRDPALAGSLVEYTIIRCRRRRTGARRGMLQRLAKHVACGRRRLLSRSSQVRAGYGCSLNDFSSPSGIDPAEVLRDA